jgi:hypothetical protein
VWYNRGSVWRSTDDGSTWTEISGNIPSRRVRNLAYSSTDLYAATWCAHVYSTPLEGGEIFADGFESGNTTAWTTTAP